MARNRPFLTPKDWEQSDGLPRLRFFLFGFTLTIVFFIPALLVSGRYDLMLWSFCGAFALSSVLLPTMPSNMWMYSEDFIPSNERTGLFWRIVNKLPK